MKLQKKPILKGKLRGLALGVTLSALMIGSVVGANAIDKKIDDKLQAMYSTRFYVNSSNYEQIETLDEPGETVVCDGNDIVSLINTLELVDKLNLTDKLIDYNEEYKNKLESNQKEDETKKITKKEALAAIVAGSKDIMCDDGSYKINGKLYTDDSYADLKDKELVQIIDEGALPKEGIYSETQDMHELHYQLRSKSK